GRLQRLADDLRAGGPIRCVVHRAHRVPPPLVAGAPSLILSLAPYVAIVTLSIVVAGDVGLYARGVVLLVQMFLLYVYLIGTVRTREDVRFVLRWLLVGLA